MVAMSVGNENIVHTAEIYAQQLRIPDKHITSSSIKQYLMFLCFQKDRKTMLCRETVVIASII